MIFLEVLSEMDEGRLVPPIQNLLMPFRKSALVSMEACYPFWP